MGMLDNSPAQPAALNSERLAEAARYALLRRLAPAIRHDMAGALQPISMVAVLLEKRLQKPTPDMAVISKNVHDINSLAREASSACMQLMSWLAPKQDSAVDVQAGVQEAIALVATELSFQGIQLVNAVEGSAAVLPLSVVRGLFMASLLALTDSQPGPGSVVITAVQTDSHTAVVLELTSPDDGSANRGDDDFNPAPSAYRALDWDDVRALAAAESASLVFSANRVELQFAR
jgi:hypothetical protein